MSSDKKTLKIQHIYNTYVGVFTDSSEDDVWVLTADGQRPLESNTKKLSQAGGLRCMIFKTDKGCQLCYDSDRISSFKLHDNKFYSGCEGDVKEAPLDCKSASQSLQCYHEKKKAQVVNFKTYYRNQSFILEVEDNELKKVIYEDTIIQKLQIIPETKICNITNSYKTVLDKELLEKEGIVSLKFKPQVSCRQQLEKNKINSFLLIKPKEKNKTSKQMQYFKLGMNENKLQRLSSEQTETQENAISSFSLDKNQLKFYYYSPEQAKIINIKKEV